MQNQKTLAKWLAVALLLMVAVACYVALSAILKKDNDTANTTAVASESDGRSKQSPEIQQAEPKIPVYSTFPRRAEQIGNVAVQHVGGEGDETYLASFVFGEKTLVLFSSLSTEYDVKESGIHIAELKNDYLLATHHIASDEKYLSSILSKNGVLIVTASGSRTVFRTINQNCEIISTSFADKYESVLLTIDPSTRNVRAFAADDMFVYSLSLDDTMNVTQSSFVFQMPNAQLLKALNYSQNTLVFMQNQSDCAIVSFCTTNGFNLKNRLLNYRFVQILPNSSNTNFAFCALLGSTNLQEKSHIVCTFDFDQNMIASHPLQGLKSGALMQADEMIMLVTGDTKFEFCSHLELVSKSKYVADNSLFVGAVEVKNVDGTPYFIRTDGITFQIVDTTFSMIFSAKGKDVQIDFLSPSSNKLRITYEAKNNDVLTYMAFGGYDVFLIETAI